MNDIENILLTEEEFKNIEKKVIDLLQYFNVDQLNSLENTIEHIKSCIGY